MSNVGQRKLEILEPYRTRFEYLYSNGADLTDIVDELGPALTEAGVPVERRRAFLTELANKWEVRWKSNATSVDETLEWENEQIKYLSLQVEKERQSRKIAESKYRALQKEYSLESRIIDTLKTVIVAADPVEVPTDLHNAKISTKDHNLVALLSDLHIGEVVEPAQVLGLDEYNLEVFSRRLNRWVDNLLYLTELKRTRLNVPKLEIFGLGDFVSGEIHDELIRTNEFDVFQQVYFGVRELSKAFLRLAPHFDEIVFTGVAGNHGRNAKRPYAKNKQGMNFDTLIYNMMSIVLYQQTNIKFIIPDSFITSRNVLGMEFVLTHGDNIRGSLGIPLYGINRVRNQLKDILGGHHFDMFVIGHFHHYLASDSVIINPAWKGVDEYSLSGYFGANRPTQLLLTIHPEHGIVSSEHIFLDDKNVNKVDFTAPPSWGERIYADD